MEKGTYTIVCTQAATDWYNQKTSQVTLKIVGDYVRNVVYTETSGTGTFSFDTHDMTEALGVTTTIGISVTNGKEMSEEGNVLSSPAYNDQLQDYKTYTTTNLVHKLPNSNRYGYNSNYPDYDIIEGSTTDKKTDFIIEYNRTQGHSYSVTGLVRSPAEARADFLLYIVNITHNDPSGFWPVPSTFNQTAGTDIEGNIAGCPLTLGGSGTYSATAKTCDDADYKTGTNVFSYTTAGTEKASQIVNLIPHQGTYYKFDPQYDDMLLTVGIALPKRKTLMIIDSYNGTSTSMKDLGSGLQGWRDVNGTITLEAQAGHSYYFYSPDYPLQIFGYEYSRAEE